MSKRRIYYSIIAIIFTIMTIMFIFSLRTTVYYSYQEKTQVDLSHNLSL